MIFTDNANTRIYIYIALCALIWINMHITVTRSHQFHVLRRRRRRLRLLLPNAKSEHFKWSCSKKKNHSIDHSVPYCTIIRTHLRMYCITSSISTCLLRSAYGRIFTRYSRFSHSNSRPSHTIRHTRKWISVPIFRTKQQFYMILSRLLLYLEILFANGSRLTQRPSIDDDDFSMLNKFWIHLNAGVLCWV